MRKCTKKFVLALRDGRCLQSECAIYGVHACMYVCVCDSKLLMSECVCVCVIMQSACHSEDDRCEIYALYLSLLVSVCVCVNI